MQRTLSVLDLQMIKSFGGANLQFRLSYKAREYLFIPESR